MDAFGQRLDAGRLHRRQSVGEHRGEDFDHLPVAVIGSGELAPHPLQRRRQHPVLERRAVAQSARLAGQNRHIMPGIVDRLAAAVAARMLGHDAPVLADHDRDRRRRGFRPGGRPRWRSPSICCCRTAPGRSSTPRPATRGIRRSGRDRERAWDAPPRRPPRSSVGPLGMGMRLGPGDAFVHQPGVQLVIALDAQAAA